MVKHSLLKENFLPVQYGSAPPDLPTGSNLFIVDFSYSPEVILDLQDKHTSVVVLDHHKTALRLKDMPGCHIDTTECGSMLAYRYLKENIEGIQSLPRFDMPVFLTYINDHDLWIHKQPYWGEFIAALRSYPLTLSAWDDIGVMKKDSAYRLAREGEPILRYQNKIVKRLAKTAYYKKIESYMVPTVCTSVLHSEVCNELLDRNQDAKLACAYSFVEDADNRPFFKVKYSLRSRPGEVDVSLIAEKHGGGGHPCAAGFALTGKTCLVFKE